MTIVCPRCQCRIELLTGEPLNLTLTEHRLLQVLRQHPLHYFTRDELLELVWDWPMDTVTRATTTTVRTHITRLRQKLAEAGYPDEIDSQRGRGWRLNPHAVQEAAA